MFIVLCLLWINKFYFMPQPTDEYIYSSYFFINESESAIWKYFSTAIAFVVYLLIAILTIKINFKIEMLESSYQTIGIFFLILSGFFLNTQRIIPEMIACMFMYGAFFKLFYTYNKNKVNRYIFDAGLLFGLAILASHKFIFFFPLLIYVLSYICISLSFREFVILLFGFLTPLVTATSIIYLYFDFNLYINYIVKTIIQTKDRFSLGNVYVFSPIIIIAATIIIYMFFIKEERKIFSRKIRNIFVIISLYIMLLFIMPIANNELIITLYLPLSFFLSKLCVNTHKIVSTLMFYGLIVVAVLLQILQLNQFGFF